MEDGFIAVRKGAQIFYDSLNENLGIHESNHTNGVEAILGSLIEAKNVLSSVSISTSNIQQRVNAIPTNGELA